MQHSNAKARDDALCTVLVTKLVAGGGGAAGIPYSSVPALLAQDTLSVIKARSGGMPVAAYIREAVLPAGLEAIKDRIKADLLSKQFSLAIDGGSCSLANGAKIVAVMAVGPTLRHDYVLATHTMWVHENAAVQATIIEAACKEYAIQPAQIKWIVADNTNLNPATVEVLRGKGWGARYARCFPHCLNLVMVSLDLQSPWHSNRRHPRSLHQGLSSALCLPPLALVINISVCCV